MSIQAYISSEEVVAFSSQTELHTLIGHYYEWEGENVVHLHSHPLTHSFGKSGKCLFTKDAEVNKDSFNNGIDYIVVVRNITCVLVFSKKGDNLLEIEASFIPSQNDLYSRNKGLLEVDVLSKKHVAIVGLGSFGSQIAIELTKAGVGVFSLFDFDRVELHNLARHTCTIKDLGRLKINAIEDAILGKNPYAIVHKYATNISSDVKTIESIMPSIDLLICATDNNESRFVISKLLYKYGKIGVFGRAITRAAGGDVFRYRPGGPCYNCLIGSQFINPDDEEISSELAGRRSGIIPAYASSDDVNTMVQVGLSADIEPICNLMLKITLVELSKDEESGISSLEDDLKYDAYIWANRRDKNFANWHPFYKSGKAHTILKWYGITVPKDEHCPICSEDVELDLGEKYRLNSVDIEGVDINLDK